MCQDSIAVKQEEGGIDDGMGREDPTEGGEDRGTSDGENRKI